MDWEEDDHGWTRVNVDRAITGWWFVVLDLGQSRDFTALAVLERVRRAMRTPELDGRCHVAVDLPRSAGLKATILPAIVTGGAGRDARRPGVRGGAGVLGGAEDVPEGGGGGAGRAASSSSEWRR
jgi:hypothetical protein